MRCYSKLRLVYQALGCMAAVDAELDRHELEGLQEIIGEIVTANQPGQEVKNSE